MTLSVDSEREERERLIRLERAMWERKCRRDLTAWTIEALAPMNQTPAAHHRLLLSRLEQVASGEIDRLMVLMPPGSAKSIYCSVLFPAWMFAQQSNFDVIGASHGSDLAEDFSGRIQGHIRAHSDLLGYQLASENVKRWRTSNGGFYRAAGVGGSITGRRADLGIIDDPVKSAADAESETVRQSTWEWYQSEFYTRLKPGARIVVIMTRWNPDDLGGRLLEAQAAGGDQWTVVKLPAIADSVSDPLGRPIGAALWPDWQDEEALARIATNVGPYVWGALYQQDPKPRGASFFDIDDLLVPEVKMVAQVRENDDGPTVFIPNETGRKVPVPMPNRCDTVFGVIDTAIKTGKKRDSTAVTWFSYNSLTKPSTLILDWDIVQVEGADQEAWLPGVIARSEELARYCGARKGSSGVLIEDKATGTVLIQQAQNQARKEGKRALAHAIDSKLTSLGKDERAIAAAPYIIAGDVKMTVEAYEKTKVHKGRSANHFIVQVTDFRLGAAEGAADDLLDTFTYGVSVTCGTNAGDRRGI